MNRLLNSFLLTSCLVMLIRPALAGEIPNNDLYIKRFEGSKVEMKNGRTFELLNGSIIEYPEDKALLVKNIFDFDNGLIYHQDLDTQSHLAVTPFSQIAPERLEYVRTLGCRIAARSGANNPVYADEKMHDFVRKNCLEKKANQK